MRAPQRTAPARCLLHGPAARANGLLAPRIECARVVGAVHAAPFFPIRPLAVVASINVFSALSPCARGKVSVPFGGIKTGRAISMSQSSAEGANRPCSKVRARTVSNQRLRRHGAGAQATYRARSAVVRDRQRAEARTRSKDQFDTIHRPASAAAAFARPTNFFRGKHRRGPAHRIARGRHQDNRGLYRGRIGHVDLHRGTGQAGPLATGRCPLVFNRVLGGKHGNGWPQGRSCRINGQLFFLHRLPTTRIECAGEPRG